MGGFCTTLAAMCASVLTGEVDLLLGAERSISPQPTFARAGVLLTPQEHPAFFVGALGAANLRRTEPSDLESALIMISRYGDSNVDFQMPFLERRFSLDLIAGVRAPRLTLSGLGGGPYLAAGAGLIGLDSGVVVWAPELDPPARISEVHAALNLAALTEAGFEGWFSPRVGFGVAVRAHRFIAPSPQWDPDVPPVGRTRYTLRAFSLDLRVRL